MNNELVAYLAGCIDCDGYITIKKSTYHMRIRGDATQAIYSERMGLKQVADTIPNLLKESFGGCVLIEKPSAKRGQMLYSWQVTDLAAYKCAEILIPFLKVKLAQAHILINLRRLKEMPRIKTGDTFDMANRWGKVIHMPRRIVNPEITRQKDGLFNHIKSLNDIRPTNPRLV